MPGTAVGCMAPCHGSAMLALPGGMLPLVCVAGACMPCIGARWELHCRLQLRLLAAPPLPGTECSLALPYFASHSCSRDVLFAPYSHPPRATSVAPSPHACMDVLPCTAGERDVGKEVEERCLSLVANLLGGCVKPGRAERVAAKFVEAEFEKVDRLMELFFRCAHQWCISGARLSLPLPPSPLSEFASPLIVFLFWSLGLWAGNFPPWAWVPGADMVSEVLGPLPRAHTHSRTPPPPHTHPTLTLHVHVRVCAHACRYQAAVATEEERLEKLAVEVLQGDEAVRTPPCVCVHMCARVRARVCMPCAAHLPLRWAAWPSLLASYPGHVLGSTAWGPGGTFLCSARPAPLRSPPSAHTHMRGPCGLPSHDQAHRLRGGVT